MSLLRPVYAFPATADCSSPNILLQISARKKSALNDLLNVRFSLFTHHTTHPSLSSQSDATRRPPVGRRRQPVSFMPMVQTRPPTINPQQPVFIRLRQLLHFTPRTNAGPPRDPLDVSPVSRSF
jgi:hypothetical protein